MKMSKEKYASMYGPTVGDRFRLADTSLIAKIEKDYTTYGEESNLVVEKLSVMEWLKVQLLLKWLI